MCGASVKEQMWMELVTGPQQGWREGRWDCVCSEMAFLQKAWSGRVRSHGRSSILKDPGRLILLRPRSHFYANQGEAEEAKFKDKGNDFHPSVD